MNKILLLIIFYTLSQATFAQSKEFLDSLFHEFVSTKNFITTQRLQQDSIPREKTKCQFELNLNVKINFENFSQTQKDELKILLRRPMRSNSIVSPSGFFRIHYDLTGVNAVAYNINDFARALDSSYNFTVNFIGYPAPPSDLGFGGDDKYDVYIGNLGQVYGSTIPEVEVSSGSNTFTTYIEVDNDFIGFYTTGIQAARVTAAHEFLHAIQLGNYPIRDEGGIIVDRYFYEISATAMEEFVFPDVNDYVAYIDDFFFDTGRAFPNTAGYDKAIWNLFLQKKFDHNLIKRQWELFGSHRALNAIDFSLQERGSSFAELYPEFAEWIFFTNYRTKSNQYFTDALKFPVINSLFSSDLLQNINQARVNYTSAKPTSINYLTFVNNFSSPRDTFHAAIVNTDIDSANINPLKNYNFTYTLFYNPRGSNNLIFDYSSKFIFSSGDWQRLEILNNRLLNSSRVTEEFDYAYPNPFLSKVHENIKLPVNNSQERYASLKIYSSSMKLVYSFESLITEDNNKRVVKWDGRNNNGEKMGSGVYIYSIKIGEESLNGKLVIINE